MIHMVLPGLPTSVNEAYYNLIKKGKDGRMMAIRVLSAKAKKYKRETAAYIVQNFPSQLMFFKPNVPYGLAIQFAFTALENKGFAKGKAKSRYKRVDVSNRLKIIEDVLAEVAAIDDSQNLTAIIDKCKHSVEETRIWVWDIVQEGEFPDAVLNALRGM